MYGELIFSETGFFFFLIINTLCFCLRLVSPDSHLRKLPRFVRFPEKEPVQEARQLVHCQPSGGGSQRLPLCTPHVCGRCFQSEVREPINQLGNYIIPLSNYLSNIEYNNQTSVRVRLYKNQTCGDAKNYGQYDTTTLKHQTDIATNNTDNKKNDSTATTHK